MREPSAPPVVEWPNLRHLRLFDATVRLGSLSAAAEAVHVSQPAASQAMTRLAGIFGARLLERGATGLTPTEAGRVVQVRTARALQHLADAGRRLAPRARNRLTPGGALERRTSIAQLRALAVFAEAGSFAAVARRLGQTEPAVQRAARALERLTGVPLFEGQQHALRLTASGELVAAQAGLALKEIAAAQTELREHAGIFDSPLVIGTLPLVRTKIVPDAVVDLMGRHPEARIEVLDGAYATLVRSLRSGTCDMIVGALRGPACPPGLQETPLFDDRLSIVARAEHPLAGRAFEAAELAGFPWVLPRRSTPARAIFTRLVAERGVADPARGHVETGSLVALRGILLASDAVSIISLRQIEYEVRQGLLVPLALDLPESGRPIGTTVLHDWQPTALMAAFRDCLVEASRRSDGNDSGRVTP